MLALSIRQPYVELILRGMKMIEYRSRPTRIIGERFWIYASKTKVRVTDGTLPDERKAWSSDLSIAPPPPWMIELANGLRLFPHDLPTGVIVGSAVIEKVKAVESRQWRVESQKIDDPSALSTLNAPPSTMFEWHLTDVRRLKTPRKPVGHPQPVWWRPG